MSHIQPRYLYLAGVIVVILCYLFVDRSVAYFVEEHGINLYSRLLWLEGIPTWFVFALPFTLLWGIIRATSDKSTYLDHSLLTGSLALILTIVLTYTCKFVFARHWPDTFVNNNPSLLQHGFYGFRWFEWDRGLQAFPSGHTAAIFSVATSLQHSYPRFSGIGVALCVCVVIGLLGLNYHFVSDVIAGAMLGIFVSNIVFRLYSEPSIQH